MKYTLLIPFFLLFLYACAQPPEQITNGFPFYMPPNDSLDTENLPQFPVQNIDENGFVSVDKQGQFVVGGEVIRFWGNNLIFDAAFPPKEKAPEIAARMRKMGFNLVRFHHIDNPHTNGSLFVQGQTTRKFNPEMLDRFEFLVAELKKQGIYVNMNLLVSRKFHPADGLADADSLGPGAKGAGLFDPELMALQKEFAQQLFTHRNPYTGLTLAEDPVLAMVEAINENSLFRMWRNGELKPFAVGGKLTSRHSQLLDQKWHSFLQQKYGSNERLRESWAAPSASVSDKLTIQNGGFEEPFGGDNWRLDAYENAQATLGKSAETVEGGASAEVLITQNTGTDWHVQLLQNGISVEKGKGYAIQFYAKADGQKALSISVMRDNEPYTYYSGQVFPVGTEWQKYIFNFAAPEDNDGHARVSINFQDHLGRFWIDDIRLLESAGTSLAEGESLEKKNIALIPFEMRFQYSDNRVRDLMHFYAQVQRDFLTEMYRFLKEDLGIKAPISGTNWFAGPEDPWTQAGLDYLDNHAYWDHPTFPSGDWSPTNWQIRNEPMVRAADGGTLTKLFAGYQVAGKPYTISEYNHTFPNLYLAEMMPMITAYSAFHGADAIMFFDYNADNDWEADVLKSFFSLDRNSLLMAASPLFAKAFREGWMAEASGPLLVEYSPEDIALTAKRADKPWVAGMPFEENLALTHKIVVSGFEAKATKNAAANLPAPTSPFKTSTGEIEWDLGGFFKIAAPKMVSFSGFLGDFPKQQAGPVSLVSADGFGALTWIPLDDKPLAESGHSLICLTSRIANQEMGWQGKTSLGDQWGKAPTVMSPLKVTLEWSSGADMPVIYPLDEVGNKKAGESFKATPKGGGKYEIVLDQVQHPTLWFAVEVEE